MVKTSPRPGEVFCVAKEIQLSVEDSSTTLPEIDSRSPFDRLAQLDEFGRWVWSGRDMVRPLGYSKWGHFIGAIERAKISAVANGMPNVDEEFRQVVQLPDAGNLGAVRRVDYLLSRDAAYLVAMNGDVRKPEIASAQAYFVKRAQEAEAVSAQPAGRSAEVDAAMIQALGSMSQVLAKVSETQDMILSRIEALEARPQVVQRGRPMSVQDFCRLKGLDATFGDRVAPRHGRVEVHGRQPG